MNAMIRVRPLLWSLFAASCVSACAVPPARVGEALAHAPLSAAGPFHLVARFSLQLQATETTEARHFAGRLQWQHGADGDRLWIQPVTSDSESELDAYVARQRGYDPDLWVVEIEDRQGRHFITEKVQD